MKVAFRCLANATVRESWEADVPDGLTGDALEDALWSALDDGTARFVEEEVFNEQDRGIEPGSIDIQEKEHAA